MTPGSALAGTFTGATLQVDPETGFLTTDPTHTSLSHPHGGFGPISVFQAKIKVKFLEIYRQTVPDFSKACRELGISVRTYKNHLKIDEAFAEAIENIEDEHVCEIETIRFRHAKSERWGAFDRMCVLNAWRAERYNPKVKIQIDHEVNVAGRSDRIGEVIDAQIVESIQRMKAERRKSREISSGG